MYIVCVRVCVAYVSLYVANVKLYLINKLLLVVLISEIHANYKYVLVIHNREVNNVMENSSFFLHLQLKV